MKARLLSAIFMMAMGLSIIGMWLMFYFTRKIPELTTEPNRIIMHLAAEYITAIFLIVASCGLLGRARWGRKVAFFSLGMLMYTLIQSPGYFMHKGEAAYVLMYSAFFILAIAVFIALFKVTDEEYAMKA